MSESIIFNGPYEDTKYLTYVKEEPLDATSLANIDIKSDSPCSTIKEEIYIKQDPWQNNDELDNVKLRSSDPLEPSSSNLEVCSTEEKKRGGGG